MQNNLREREKEREKIHIKKSYNFIKKIAMTFILLKKLIFF